MLRGLFYPFVAKALTGDNALGPYTIAFIFSVGVLLCTIPVNLLLLRYPITGGTPLRASEYVRGSGLGASVRIAWRRDLVHGGGAELRGGQRPDSRGCRADF